MKLLLAVYTVFVPMGHHHCHGPMTEEKAKVFSVLFLLSLIGAIIGCIIHVRSWRNTWGEAEPSDYVLGFILGFVITMVFLFFGGLVLFSITTLLS